MFIKVHERSSKNNKKLKSFRIMESVRNGSKTMHKTVQFVGSSTNPEVIKTLEQLSQELLVKLSNDRQPAFPTMTKVIYSKEPQYINKKPKPKLKQKKKPKPPSLFSLTKPQEKARVHYGVKGVCGAVYKQMGFQDLIKGTKKDKQWNEILKYNVLSRIADPESKRKTVETLREDFNEEIHLDKMYRMMDRLYPHIDKVKNSVAENTLSLFNQKVDILFFDVTTLYFESTEEDDMRQFGYSKDLKFNDTQVVLALITNQEGHPLSYELFPGKTSEANTLIQTVEKLKKRFSVQKTVLVADRAMFSDKNLHIMEENGMQYVVAAKLKSLPKAQRQEILNKELFKPSEVAGELQQVQELEHKDRRLIVSYSKKRANKNESDRQRLIERLLKKVHKNQIPIKNLISNHGTKKYIKVENNTKAILNEKKIKEDSLWDGLHGVVTNIEDRSAKELLTRYRKLWKIEEAFRVCKHTLKMRPIYHWKKERIESHIAICFLAYCLSYTMKYRMEQRGVPFSIQKMREVLKRDQYSVIEDQRTKKLYRMPSKFSEPIKAIYEAFGIKRVSQMTPVS